MSVGIVESAMTGRNGPSRLRAQLPEVGQPVAATVVVSPDKRCGPASDPDVEYPCERFGLRSVLLLAMLAPFGLAVLVPLTWYSAQLLDDGLFALLLVAGGWGALFWTTWKRIPTCSQAVLVAHQVSPMSWVALIFRLGLRGLLLVPIAFIFLMVGDATPKHALAAQFAGLIFHVPLMLGVLAAVFPVISGFVDRAFDRQRAWRWEMGGGPADLFPPSPAVSRDIEEGRRYFWSLPILRAIPDPEIQVISCAIALEHCLYFQDHAVDAPPDLTFNIRNAIEQCAIKLGFRHPKPLHDAWKVRNGLVHSENGQVALDDRSIRDAAQTLLRGVERAAELLPRSARRRLRPSMTINHWRQTTRVPQVESLQTLVELAGQTEHQGERVKERVWWLLNHGIPRSKQRRRTLQAALPWMRLITWGWHMPTDGEVCGADCANCRKLPPGKKPLAVIRRIQDAELRLVLLAGLLEYLVNLLRPTTDPDAMLGSRIEELLVGRMSVTVTDLRFGLRARNKVVHPNEALDLDADGVERAVHYLYEAVQDLIPLLPADPRHAVTTQRPSAWPGLPDEVGPALQALQVVAVRLQERRRQVRKMELPRRWICERLDRLSGLEDISMHLAHWFHRRPTLSRSNGEPIADDAYMSRLMAHEPMARGRAPLRRRRRT